MPEKKETALGIALFLYFIAFLLVAVSVYNIFYVGVFNNYELTENLELPSDTSSVFYKIAYGYVSLFFPLFGNTAPCAVLSVSLPVTVIVTLAASVFLSKHLEKRFGVKNCEQ